MKGNFADVDLDILFISNCAFQTRENCLSRGTMARSRTRNIFHFGHDAPQHLPGEFPILVSNHTIIKSSSPPSPSLYRLHQLFWSIFHKSIKRLFLGIQMKIRFDFITKPLWRQCYIYSNCVMYHERIIRTIYPRVINHEAQPYIHSERISVEIGDSERSVCTWIV